MRNRNLPDRTGSRLQPGAAAIVALGALLAFAPARAQSEIKVVAGDQVRRIPVLERDGVAYVTARDLAGVFGAEMLRDDRSASLVILIGENRIELPAEGNHLSVNGEVMALPAPVRRRGTDLWLPFDFILQVVRPLYDRGLVWSPEESTLLITERKPLAIDLEVSFSEQGARAVFTFSRKTAFRLVPQGRRMVVRLSAAEIRAPFARRDYEGESLRKVRFYRTSEGGQITLQAARGFEEWNHRVEEGPFRLILEVTRGAGSLLAGDLLRPAEPGRGRARPPAAPMAPGMEAPTPIGGSRADGRWTIVIDPGHGGEEIGATGPSGMSEKDLVLDIGLRLRRLFEPDPTVRVILTRDSDLNIGLEERTALANHHRADLFLSIHANASDWPEAHGAETYFLSPSASDDDARRTAALENNALDLDRITDERQTGLRMILWDLAQVEFLEESSELAESIQDELNRVLRIENRGIKQAPFLVLTGATMPAVLVEIGFLSNPNEEERFEDSDYKQRIAGALHRSILRYRRNLELRNGGAAAREPIRLPDGS